ncbi:hypothetical protein ACLB2K_070623 [Fragaria x ananassa]
MNHPPWQAGSVLAVNDEDDDEIWELPAAAVKKYGHQMGDHIFLKVPNWEEPWKVKLSKSPCGYVVRGGVESIYLVLLA